MKQNPEPSSLKIGNRRKTLVLLVASAFAFSSSVSWGQLRNAPSLNQGASAMTIVRPPGQRSGERSINLGSQPIAVVFANQTNENLVAHWIDLNGVGQELGLLVPGQSVEITTFPGHVTTFSSGSRRVATFRASTSSNAAYAILGTGGTTVNMGPVTQFNPSFTGGQIGGAGTGITLNNIGSFIKSLLNGKQSPFSGGSGLSPGTNIGTNPGTNIGTNPGNPQISNTGSGLTPQAARELVNFHNRVRNDVGVGPVTWDPAIAKFAQDYANKLATTIGRLQHNSNRNLNGVTLGENLAWGSSGNWTVVQLADGWESKEKHLWAPGSVIPNGSNPAGHYTQIIWRNSTRIGAGMATGPTGTYLVCNYSPAGNFVGQKPH